MNESRTDQYRKKPVVITAKQLTHDNIHDIVSWINRHSTNLEENAGILYDASEACVIGIHIPTLEGVMEAKVNDFVIQGVVGEFYPCKPDVFEDTYEKVNHE